MDAPSLQAFKARLDVALGSLGCWLATLHIAGGWNWMSIVGPFQPRLYYDSMILYLHITIVQIRFYFILVRFCTLYCHSIDVKADAASSIFKWNSVHGFLKVLHLSLVDMQSFPKV